MKVGPIAANCLSVLRVMKNPSVSAVNGFSPARGVRDS